MASRFAGKIAIVTGASSGIGAATAERLAKDGATVIVTGRNAAALQGTLDKCKSLGANASVAEVGDVNDDAHRGRLVAASEKLGGVDILVNNAGYGGGGSAGTGDLSYFDEMFKTNVRSVIALTQALLPQLTAKKGCVVNVSSVAGLRPNAQFGLYCVTKSALDQFTRCLALEVGQRGIRVNAVNPAAVTTNFGVRASGGQFTREMTDKLMEHMGTTYPLGRHGVPEDIAASIAFLASEEASWITGQTMVLDGGSTMTSSSTSLYKSAESQLK